MTKVSIFTLFFLFSMHTAADSFRCGRTLVKVGESSNALIKKCGKPVRKYSAKVMINDHGMQKKVGVSNWVYTRRGKRDMIVSVNSGEVLKIKVE